METTTRWQDWSSFALGVWLAVSPWAAGYHGNDAATGNAAVAGLALALAAHYEASCSQDAAEWLNLAIGLWLVGAPLALGFTAHPAAAANSVGVGAIVALLALSALGLHKELVRRLNDLPGRHSR